MTGVKAVFDETAQHYDEGRRTLLPCFDDFYGMVMKLVTFPTEAHIRVLDLGAGTGILSHMIGEAFPTLGSHWSISRPKCWRLPASVSVRRRASAICQADITLLAMPGEFDVVVSALAIHHLRDDEKHELYGDIYKTLCVGGIFINAEQVQGPTAVLEKSYDDMWLAEIQALGASKEDIAQARKRMAEDRPATLEVQLAWLREVGFRHVDCWYKNGRFAVFCGAVN